MIDNNNSIFVPVTWFTKYGLMSCLKGYTQYVFYYPGEDNADSFAKRIIIDKSGYEVKCLLYTSETKSNTYFTHEFSSSLIVNGTLYLPLPEILPFFNAKVEITSDGILHIYANAVSLFSALYGIDLNSLKFDAEKDMVGSEYISGIETLFDSILGIRVDCLDGLYNTDEYNDYSDLFKSYLKDNELFLSVYDTGEIPSEKFIQEKREILKDVDELLGDTKQFPKAIAYMLDADMYEGFHEFKDFYSDMSDVAEGIYKVADYSSTYMKQVDDHLNMLEAVYSDDYFGTANPARKAAMNSYSLYGNDRAKKHKEIVVSSLHDYLSNEFSGTVIKEFGLTPYSIASKAVKKVLPEETEIIGNAAQLEQMNTVVSNAYTVFDKRVKDIQLDTEHLNDIRLSAMLAVVASHHAYNTFWDKHDKVDELNDLLVALYLAAESIECESSDYYSEKASELESCLSNLGIKKTASNTAAKEIKARAFFDSVRTAYAKLLQQGIVMNTDAPGIPNSHPSHYYMFDMNRDYLDELIVINAETPGECSFEVCTYKAGQTTKIVDSVNTCDLSHWGNASIKLSIINGVIYAFAENWRTLPSENYLVYDGKSVKNYIYYKQPPSYNASNDILLVDNDGVYAIEINSPEDFLQSYYVKEVPSTPVLEKIVEGIYTRYINDLTETSSGWKASVGLFSPMYYPNEKISKLLRRDILTIDGFEFEVENIKKRHN